MSCPNRCDNPDIEDVIGKNNFITKFKFKCIKGCGEDIPFDNIKKHYSSDCLSKKKKKKSNILSKEEVAKYKKENKCDIPHMTIITLGTTGVGKTSLINTFIKGEGNIKNFSTIAVDFVAKCVQLSDGSVVNCLIYDTAGQERFNSINETYYKKADAVLLVYDITNKESFDLIRNYYCPKIKEFCKKKIPIILLGNKTDMEEERLISMEDGIALSVEYKFKFCQTSCLKNENVADAFEALIELWNFENQKKINNVSIRRRPILESRNDSEFISSKTFKKMNTSRYNSVVLDENLIEEKSFQIMQDNKDKSKAKKKKKRFC